MDIILLEKIANLGNLGEKVSVKPGYGRNYLIPQGKATVASAAKLAEFEQRRADLEKKANAELAAAQVRAASLAELTVTIAQKAGEDGRLYGSVGTRDIAEAITAAGVPVVKQEVRLPNGVIRALGEYSVALQIHSDVDAVVALKVVAE